MSSLKSGRLFLYFLNRSPHLKGQSIKCCSGHVANNKEKQQTGIWANPTIIKWMTAYEDLVGLTEVKNVQNKVVEAEQNFQQVQLGRRQHQHRMQEIQAKLKEIHGELEKVQRGDEKYLTLLTEEHQIIREERTVARELGFMEDKEHATFAALSSAVRESHEKERSRAERTKYWSVSASVVGVILGVIGTSINNYVRMRELRQLVREQSKDGVELKGLLHRLSDTVVSEHKHVRAFITDLKHLLGGEAKGNVTIQDAVKLNSHAGEMDTKQMLEVILKQDKELLSDMTQLKDTLAKVKIFRPSEEDSAQVMYTDADLEDILGQTESRLEYGMKVNALWTVTAVYAALALTLPVLYNIFTAGS